MVGILEQAHQRVWLENLISITTWCFTGYPFVPIFVPLYTALIEKAHVFVADASTTQPNWLDVHIAWKEDRISKEAMRSRNTHSDPHGHVSCAF
jgi:hypothetical protein